MSNRVPNPGGFHQQRVWAITDLGREIVAEYRKGHGAEFAGRIGSSDHRNARNIVVTPLGRAMREAANR